MRRVAAWSLAVSLCAATSRADPPRAVELAVSAGAEGAAFETSVRALVEREPVALTVTSPASLDLDALLDAPAGGLLCRVGLSVRGDRARLVLRSGDRALVRDVPLPRGFDEVTRESLALLLRDAIDALLAGGEIGVARPTPPPPPPAPAPPTVAVMPVAPTVTPPATAWRFALGAHESMSGFADAAVAHGPMVSLSLTRGARVHWGVEVTGQYRFPVTVDGAPVGVRIDQGALRACARVDVDLGARASLVARAGAGVDVVTPTARLTQADRAALDDTSTRVEPVLALGAGARIHLAPRVALAVDVGVDLALSPARYTVTGLPGDVLAPWSVRPTGALGLVVAASP